VLTDDNFGLGERMNDLCDELIKRGFSDDITCFMQARCDDVVRNLNLLPKMCKVGIDWLLLGVKSHSKTALENFKKGTKPEDAKAAVKLLNENGIFSQATCIIGERKDSAKSIANLREFVNDLDPGLAIFMILTPYPGTDLFEEAERNGWIEEWNWANYDMLNAVMPTETLSRNEVQEELYKCYRSFFGSWRRSLLGVFSDKKIKRRMYRYMAGQNVIRQLKSLV